MSSQPIPLPPLISRVEASVTGRDSVAVTWWTDEPADSYVEYWASGISLARVGTSQMTTSHSVMLPNIRSGVVYYYRVVSTDTAGNRAQSADMTFRLQPPDTTPPTVRLSINNGAQLTNSTTVQLYITAQDDSGGALEMSLRDDKTQFGQWQPYTAYTTWRFSSGDGRRTVTVRVRDAAGNEAQASASITVDATPPAISWVEVKSIGPDSATVTWRTISRPTPGSSSAPIRLARPEGRQRGDLAHRDTLRAEPQYDLLLQGAFGGRGRQCGGVGDTDVPNSPER